MRVRGLAALALIVVLAATVSGGAVVMGAPAAQSAAPIRLKVATFSPALGERVRMPFAMTRRQAAADRPSYYLVQLSGPVQQEWKDELAATGAEILDYIPDNAFKVRMRPEVAAQVRSLGEVSYVGLWHPFYSIDPAALAGGQQLLLVTVERGGDRAAVEQAIGASGATALGTVNDRLLVGADRAQIEGFAQALDVAWVEPFRLNETHNEYGGSGIIKGSVAYTRGYDGSSQIAAVADTGLGGGTAETAHPDIPASRIAAIYNWPGVADTCFQTIVDDGAQDVDSGHGTHVAGSVLSDGDANGVGKGVAPAARLVFQATDNYVIISNFCRIFGGYQNGYYLTGLTNLSALFQQAYDAGARIHSNSWGSAMAGDYTADSVTTDTFVWGHRDFTVTFSAGNEGADANADGVVDNDSIGSPATAKNVITIGASENDRQGHYECDSSLTYTSHDTTYQSGKTCASMGGQNLLGTPRQRWGFTANPIADDPTAGNAQQMAAFSSRGPTDDGRIKPDVVAPGTWVLSTYSPMFQEGYTTTVNPRNGAFQSDGWGMPASQTYKYFGGTSMANPIAGGAATVVRDFYQKAYSLSASAALVKATLINSAVDLLDENNDGVDDNDFPIPNNHEGWGLINLDAATDGTAQYVDNTGGISTGSTATYSYNVSGGQPLKISLVWSDYPSTASAAANLVNNLNLTVIGPGGTTTYRGNVFSGGWSTAGGSADTVNNVENVFVQSAAAGTWTVQVSGANVPQGPQPFALVMRGVQPAPPPTPPAAPSNLGATAASSSQIDLAWADNSSNEDGFKIERSADSINFTQIITVGANVTSYSNTGLTPSTAYTYRVRAYNAVGDSLYSNTASATTGAGPILTGYLSPAANAAVTSGAGDNNGFQTFPTGAYADDGLFAVDTNSGSGTSISCGSTAKDKHTYYNYSFSGLAGKTIQGIQVRLDAKADATTGAPKLCVQLSWDGGTTWTATKTTTTLTTAEATYTLGGAADLWGRSWTDANLTNANFRVRVIPVASNTSRDFSLDWVAVQVSYQ